MIVPIYNRATMLEQLIISIRNQTHQDIELVVIDDGSADLSADQFWSIVSRVAPDLRVRYGRQPNSGVSAARNHGLNISSGAFLYFLDSDDLIMPWAIGHLLETLEQSGGSFAVASILDSDFDLRTVRLTQPMAYTSLLDHYWYTHSALYRADAARNVGGFREGISTGEDLLFHFLIRMQQKQVSFSPTVIGVRRLHSFGHLHERSFVHDEWQAYLKAFADILVLHPALKNEPRLKRVKLWLLLLYKSTKLSPAIRADVLHSVVRTSDVLLHDFTASRTVLSRVFCLNGNVRMAIARNAIACGVAAQSVFRKVVRPEKVASCAEAMLLDTLRNSLAAEKRP